MKIDDRKPSPPVLFVWKWSVAVAFFPLLGACGCIYDVHWAQTSGMAPCNTCKEEGVQECAIKRLCLQSLRMRQVLLLCACGEEQQGTLQSILKHWDVLMLAFVKCFWQEKVRNAVSYENVTPHVIVRTTEGITNLDGQCCYTDLVVCISHHPNFTCLVICKTACEDTFVTLMMHCRTLHASGCVERRVAFTRWYYMLLFKVWTRLLTKMEIIVIVKFCEIFICVTCKWHKIKNGRLYFLINPCNLLNFISCFTENSLLPLQRLAG